MKVQTLVLTLMSTATAATFGLTGCGQKSQTKEADIITQSTSGKAVGVMKMDVNENPLSATVCDPFNELPAPALNKGIKATLRPLQSGMPTMSSSLDYNTFVPASPQKLFFADLNVPTRLFDQGFSTQTNDTLKDDQGVKLIENFGIKFETTVKLSSADSEGSYEFALLSDDGTTLKSLNGTKETVLISSDGDHPTQMGCATSVVPMTKTTSLPIVLTYYQGPRYHIANVLMWRKATKAGQDSQCWQNGNDMYFNPDNNSAPQTAFKNLQARGWKVLTADNFYLPATTNYNPCVAGTNPVLTSFKVNEVFFTSVSLSWNSDIGATTQVKLINKVTGEVILTQADNNLYLEHSVTVQNLQPETTYSAQAMSISGDFGHTMSDLIEFTTP